jgi:hypothetical protein
MLNEIKGQSHETFKADETLPMALEYRRSRDKRAEI